MSQQAPQQNNRPLSIVSPTSATSPASPLSPTTPTTPTAPVCYADEEGEYCLRGPSTTRFVVQKHLGEGSYGKVKLATDVASGRKVALKIIQKSTLKKSTHITRLKREVRIMRLLHHPNITRLYDVIETETEIILAMEYVEGGELFDYIVAHKRLKEKTARKLFRQIVSALEYCHKSSIIHRDLKPENLLLDTEKNIKIIDFGFVKLFDPDDNLKTFCGSPFYASPEMIMGKQYAGPEVDIWSMGVILFALLNGHLPFRDPNTTELYKKISTGTYEYKTQHMTPESADLIKKMLTVDPHKRATIDQVRHHPWVLAEEDGPPESFVPSHRPAHIVDPDPEILSKFSMYGIDIPGAEKAFESKEQGPAWALYCLLTEHEEWEEQEKRAAMESMDGIDEIDGTETVRNSTTGLATTYEEGSPAAVPVRSRRLSAAPRRLSLNRPARRNDLDASCRSPLTPPATTTENPFDSPRLYSLRRRASMTESRLRAQAPPVATLQAQTLDRPSVTRHGSFPRRMPPPSDDEKKDTSAYGGADPGGLALPSINKDQKTGGPELAQSAAGTTSVPNVSGIQSSQRTDPHCDVAANENRGGRRPSIAETFSNAISRLRPFSPSRSSRRLSADSRGSSPSLRISTASPGAAISPPTTLARPGKAIFGADTTSTKPPAEIIEEIQRVLHANNVKFNVHKYKITASTDESTFDIEVFKIKGTNMHALQLRRKKGSTLAYQSICQKLIAQWKL